MDIGSQESQLKNACTVVRSHSKFFVSASDFLIQVPGGSHPTRDSVLPTWLEVMLLRNKTRHRCSLTWGGCFQFPGHRGFGLPFHPQRHSDDVGRHLRGVSNQQNRFKVDEGFPSYDHSDRFVSVLLDQVPEEPAQRHPAAGVLLQHAHLLVHGVVQDDDHVRPEEGLLCPRAHSHAPQEGRHQVPRLGCKDLESFFCLLVVK